MFWALAPFLLVFLVAMPLLVPRRDSGTMIALAHSTSPKRQ